LRDQLEIRPTEHRVQIRSRRARAPSARINGDLAACKALLHFGMQIVTRRKSRGDRRLHEWLMQELPRIDRTNVQRATVAVILPTASPARLHALEVRQHISIAPSAAAQIAP